MPGETVQVQTISAGTDVPMEVLEKLNKLLAKTEGLESYDLMLMPKLTDAQKNTLRLWVVQGMPPNITPTLAVPAKYDSSQYEKTLLQYIQTIEKINQRFELISKATNDATYDWDVVNDAFEWGDAFSRIFGHEAKKPFTLGDWVALIHPADREKNAAAWHEFMDNPQQNKWHHEYLFLRSDGSYAQTEEIGYMHRSAGGKPERMIGVLRDISHERQMEKRIKNLANNIPGVLFQYIEDADGSNRLEYISEGARSIWGLSPEEAMEDSGKVWAQVVEDSLQGLVASIQESAVQQTKWIHQWRIRRNDGAIRWVEGHGTPKQLSDGGILWDTVLFDITEAKELQRLLNRASDMALIGSWIYDITNQQNLKLYWSPMTRAIFEVDDSYEPTTTLGHEFFEPSGLQEIKDGSALLLQTGEIFDKQVLITTAKGNDKWIRCIGEAEWVGDTCVKLYGSMQDIHALKSAEFELKKLNESLTSYARDLEISNAELEQFAYVASHDLQEPLRMVTSFLNKLQNKYGGLLDEKAQQYIGFAVEGAISMRQSIQDLLAYSRIGRQNVPKESFDLNEVVAEICMLQKEIIREKSATIIKENLPGITGYKAIVLQILQNLVGNSLKYAKSTEKPVITIACEDKQSDWQISVRDNGIGINEAYFQKIFLLFQRLHNKEDYGGSGIGLSVVKKSIEHLGGKIWLDSQEGVGSTFYFTLPK